MDEQALLSQDGYLPAVQDLDLEDESLTTLERIFLLSKSEFTHHRYVCPRLSASWIGTDRPYRLFSPSVLSSRR